MKISGMKINVFELVWFVVSIVLVFTAIILRNNYINLSESNMLLVWASDILVICGVTYVFGIAKQIRFAYFFGIINVILYAIVVFNQKLYISAGYNLFYSLPMMIYGYINWGKLGKSEIKKLSNKTRLLGSLGMFVAVAGLTVISKRLFNGENAGLDSLVSVCVCVATFLMAKKYIEQWALFVIANFTGVILFISINMGDMQHIELLSMWVIYLINSFYGAIVWDKTMNKGEVDKNA